MLHGGEFARGLIEVTDSGQVGRALAAQAIGGERPRGRGDVGVQPLQQTRSHAVRRASASR